MTMQFSIKLKNFCGDQFHSLLEWTPRSVFNSEQFSRVTVNIHHHKPTSLCLRVLRSEVNASHVPIKFYLKNNLKSIDTDCSLEILTEHSLKCFNSYTEVEAITIVEWENNFNFPKIICLYRLMNFWLQYY